MPTAKYKVYDKQQQFIDSKALYVAFVGGLGSGKTKAGALRMIMRAKPDRRYMVVAPNYSMLETVTMYEFVKLAVHLGALNPRDVKRSKPPYLTLLNGAEVLFRSADDPEMLRGPNLADIWIDEASQTHEDTFPICIGRLREGGDDGHQQGTLSATFTPKGKQHWTYRVFGTSRPNTELIHAPTWQNPFLPPDFFSNTREQYTTAMAEQELAGEFTDPLGTLCKRSWFEIVKPDLVPPLVAAVRAWDLAATPDEKKASDPDWTVGLKMGKSKERVRYILNVVRKRESPGKVENLVTSVADVDGRSVKISMEREPASSGIAVIDRYRKLLAGYHFEPDRKRGDKMERAHPFAAYAEHGNVKLVQGDWNEPFLDEICSFPIGPHDDQMDAASQAHWKLKDDPGHGPTHYPFEEKRERNPHKSSGKAKLARRISSHSASSMLYKRKRRSAYPLGRKRIF